jgi:hypothetical protein
LQNAKFLDQNFGHAPLKNLPGKQTKVIIEDDNFPSNFTQPPGSICIHLGELNICEEGELEGKRYANPQQRKQSQSSLRAAGGR